MKTKMYRQGDVLIRPITKLPTGLKQTKQVTLALGEVTGHHHTIFSGAVGFATEENAPLAQYFQVTEDSATLTHQEHDAIELPKGNYEKVIQSEYSPEAIRNVAD